MLFHSSLPEKNLSRESVYRSSGCERLGRHERQPHTQEPNASQPRGDCRLHRQAAPASLGSHGSSLYQVFIRSSPYQSVL